MFNSPHTCTNHANSQNLSNGIGILPQQHLSYVDHLVPLCQIMHIPLLVTDPWMKELIEMYYPPMEIVLAEPDDYNLNPFLEGYGTFFYVDFFRKGDGSFQFKDYFSTHRARSVISLHGNPDKYWEIYWIEQLSDEDLVLAYGPQLLEMLAYRGVRKQPVICGNYRLEYYKLHESFFDQKLPFQKQKETILYAPTWSGLSRTAEQRVNYSPFFDVYRTVFDTLSDRYQLIVKLHPHLIKLMPDKVDEIVQEYPHIYFLQHFPLIYPLLKQIDLYLGDYSSIGYDFLYFDRPLFFLHTSEKTPLQEYGQRMCKEDLPHLIEKTFERKRLYSHVFGEEKNLSQLKQDIEDACRSHPR
jgi:CDP-Glycerol:Poly(glycerophosphate) glycerophosphotransferase